MEKELEINFKDYNINDCYSGRYKEKYQFIMVGYSIMDNEEKLKRAANKTMFYLFLRRYAKRKKSYKDKLNIFENYYVEKALLACSWSQEALAKKFGVDIRTIGRWVKELQNDGAIKIEKIPTNNIGRGQYQNVYITGEVTDDGETYFLD